VNEEKACEAVRLFEILESLEAQNIVSGKTRLMHSFSLFLRHTMTKITCEMGLVRREAEMARGSWIGQEGKVWGGTGQFGENS
jgi:hypothetical protein